MWSYNCFQTDCLWKIFLILRQFLGELKGKKRFFLNYYEYLFVPELSSSLHCESCHRTGGRMDPEVQDREHESGSKAEKLTASHQA